MHKEAPYACTVDLPSVLHAASSMREHQRQKNVCSHVNHNDYKNEH